MLQFKSTVSSIILENIQNYGIFNDKEEGNASLLCLFLPMLTLFLLNWIESHTNQLGSLFY